MIPQLQESRTEFDWQRQPEAATLVAELVDRSIQANRQIERLARRLHDETGTRLVDWTDSLELADDAEQRRELADAGYAPDVDEPDVWRQSEGLFPAIRFESTSAANARTPLVLTVKVESVEAFAAAMVDESPSPSVGPAGAQYRTCAFEKGDAAGTTLAAAERHGWRYFADPKNRSQQIAAAAKHRQAFAKRRRRCDSNEEGFAVALGLFDAAAADLGRDWACDLFFAEERAYWMSRNHVGKVQFDRQERLGLGWGNHDHHTYRSSRESFAPLIAALVRMGFHKRERFYAGREAGWGAQVLEQSVCGFAVFADVDLSPEELAGDFSQDPLPPRDELGTVGMWCALHGEAFLEAGMHHLEAQFDFDAERSQLAALGIETLAPFTDWAHLRQAFTRGETWPVPLARIAAAYAAGHITEEQGNQFCSVGAIGSHLEILERNDGFKGFNQTGVSDIISRTDPRKQL